MIRVRKTSGFTLIELGLVLVVLSLLVGGVLAIATQNIRLAKQRELAMKMDAIEDAVLSYRKSHGFIPCPGNIALVEADQFYGFQGANAGSCVGGSPAATFTDSNTIGGMVPVRTLGLPDDYARDPWGGKFLYVVDRRATAASTFSVAKLTDPTLIGSIRVNDYTGASITTTAVLLILSHGQNGHGAYIGTARKYVNSSNLHEQDNCGCGATAVGVFDNIFYSHSYTVASTSALTAYDDITRFYSRSQLSSNTDVTTEK